MMTLTMLTNRTADICGIDPTQDSQDMTNIGQDLNTGLMVFKNAARIYWTRKQASAQLILNQQYYQLPPDCVRTTQVYVNANGLNYPVKQIQSEYIWNKINIIPAITINVPTYFFIRGRDEIGLWPIPSYTALSALNVSYEPQLYMGLPDLSTIGPGSTNNSTTATCTVTSGSTTVTFSENVITPDMVGRWFSINNRFNEAWYQISIYDSTNQIEIGNFYGGTSGQNLSFTIADAPDIPQDYHMGLVYFAAYNFFLKRKDNGLSNQYWDYFNQLLTQYKENYASKTTGNVQSSTDAYRYSIFMIPPPPITT